MKVAIYSRKSKFTGKGDSIENQVQLCSEYAKNLGLPMTAGTDIHSIENREVVAGIALEKEKSKRVLFSST